MSKGDKPEQQSVAVQPQRNSKGQIIPGGASLNPAGRPKGSRVKLEEVFVADMVEAWKLYGKDALASTATKEPAKFAQIAASVLPKQTQTTRVHKLELMTDRELAELLDTVDAQTEAQLIGRQGMN
jgi:hypothetical protein